MSAPGVRVIPVGAHALLVEVADARSARWLSEQVAAMGRSEPELSAPRDVVPAARTVLLDGVANPAAWTAALAGLRPEPATSAARGTTRILRVTYDGPDLEAVAIAWDCAPAEVAERHQGALFTVAFCGFAPGFAYCTSEPALPAVPRRPEPRVRVEPGAVGLAGEFSAVYPRAMPGGWQIIGRTSAVVFDVYRDQPALLMPGDTVRFEAES